ncbi:mute [Drosophila busckii]|uniref:Mute n=1 Tax=Drosophila busckii TaxID=30019 RepID=A0A0M3QVQ7_DROBS|nr:uncharacterized protein LOC108597296 [Drosophila busckii]ALC42813.1 mute [Drosophila busckii]
MPNSSKKSDTSVLKTPSRATPVNSSNGSVCSTPTSTVRRQARKKRKNANDSGGQGAKRRRSMDAQLGECNMDDVLEIDRRLRKVAKDNSISKEDMKKVVGRVVRNDHVLALVTLKAEDELAREKREREEEQEEKQEQRGAIIITETPSVAKLTRAKARELNCTPGITLPPLNNTPVDNEVQVLINQELHSDEDDEEYAFKEEDFHSDDDQNTTASDFDSNPCTPQTPMTANEESPIKLSEDGCFKVPLDKRCATDDPRIATRTRSKLCLQQTTIEDLQSEFVPPDVEGDMLEYDMTANDADWMQFLNDFSKPLNNSFIGDDDDPINDPEYVAADMVPVDKEELRDVNISKKELTDLVSELFAGLLQEGVSLDSIELETPDKFFNTSETAPVNPIDQVTRQIDFDAQPNINMTADESLMTEVEVKIFEPHVMSTPSIMTEQFDTSQSLVQPLNYSHEQTTQILEPFDTNFTCKYLSIRKLYYSEYEQQFEQLRHVPPAPLPKFSNQMGFTTAQHDLLQQQLRLHTQLLAQTFVQTYSHPLLYGMAEKPKEMLLELQQRAQKDVSYNCWNLKPAVELITNWEQELSSDEYEADNKKMMQFINKETELTDGNTRQVARLPPRIMNLMLDSRVFMYPQYLPRMAFQPRTPYFTAYAPSEYQLIAMGLEKHLTAIRLSKKPLRKKVDPLRVACNRMAKDLLHGKLSRRLFSKVQELRESPQYNPVKYYFDHQRAPPINQILLGFEQGIVCTPREQYELLPSAWKYYIEKNWTNDKRARRSKKQLEASAQAKTSYLEFVREAVGEDLLLPDSLGEAAAPYGSATDSQDTYTNAAGTAKKDTVKQQKKKTQRRKTVNKSTSLTINVNYVFSGDISGTKLGTGVTVPLQDEPFGEVVANINRTLNRSSECSLLALPAPLPPLADDAPSPINLSFDPVSQTVQLAELPASVEQKQSKPHAKRHSPIGSAKRARFSIFKRQFTPRRQQSSSVADLSHRSRYHLLRQRLRQKLQRRCQTLLSAYASYLQQQQQRYAHLPEVQYYYRRFIALDLYTQLLCELRMFCEQQQPQQQQESSNVPTEQPQQKRQRSEDAARNRANRQEEMLRHMLLPDAAEERNRKDATFALNFYDKVEEALLDANRLEDCQKFNQLLKNFDPKHDKVSDLYLNVEKLLLPEHPELAEVFLNFLLPAEASELGKYFEYFMITNASNFINKLNIYFCKQPAQIRKIYACLNELAELPSVSMKKVEARILPLLKGNQFLSDWFVQQFPQAKPPKRILPAAETINLHEVLNNTSGEFAETLHDLPAEAATEPKPAGCHLKYLNGRIFYGSKIMLPAKLSFRAASIYNEQLPEPLDDNLRCVHGVRTQGEKLMNAAAAADSDDAAERSEEDDPSRALIIDTTTADEENSSSSIDMCDDVTLRAHAMRLNASYYSNSFNGLASSTPTVSHNAQHHPHAKKTSINFGEVSPRKQSTALNSSPQLGLSPLPGLNMSPPQDKRKSPSKKLRSPVNQAQARPRYNMQPMVVIHEPPVRAPSASSPAIECAKRLRTLIDQPDNSPPEELDNKATIRIIARAKQLSKQAAPSEICLDLTSEDVSLSQQSFPAIKMDSEPSEDEVELVQATAGSKTPQHVITTQYDSDEDCKLDVVATLANNAPLTDATATTSAAANAASDGKAWTRDEDKVILIEMKMGARDREHLIKRMGAKLKNRNEDELRARHKFLMDFLSKLQGK